MSTKETNVRDHVYDTLIVGAGFTGLGTAIKLAETGVEDFVIVDRSDRVGAWVARFALAVVGSVIGAAGAILYGALMMAGGIPVSNSSSRRSTPRPGSI